MDFLGASRTIANIVFPILGFGKFVKHNYNTINNTILVQAQECLVKFVNSSNNKSVLIKQMILEIGFSIKRNIMFIPLSKFILKNIANDC
jgi:hypothetical protein